MAADFNPSGAHFRVENDMRGVLRALTVLRELNIHNGASILELHKATGISRSALYRIIGTLQNAGYLAVDTQSQSLRLTSMVRHLSEGYEEEAWVTEIAGPILDQLQQKVIWPTDLFTLFDDTMIMLRTTRRTSPWTFDRVMVGFRMPVLISACGRACLAHLPYDVASSLLQRLQSSAPPEHRQPERRDDIEKLLTKVRTDGYALRASGFMKETGSIAVPVFIAGTVRCAIAITYIFSAISEKDVVAKLFPLLKQAAVDIEETVARKASA